MTAGQQAARQYRMEQWSKIISDRAHSGQSVIEWCRENGVSQRVYYYRLGQVRKYAAEAMGLVNDSLDVIKTARQRGLAGPGFAEVKLAEPPAVLPSPEVSDQICIEVGEIRITVGSAYPPEKLAALLRELTRPC